MSDFDLDECFELVMQLVDEAGEVRNFLDGIKLEELVKLKINRLVNEKSYKKVCYDLGKTFLLD